MTIKNAVSIGDVQVKLEAAEEHLNSCWGYMHRILGIPKRHDWHELDYKPGQMRGPADAFAYSLNSVSMYVSACRQGMYEFVGSTEGQLCPYDDCAHDLGIESEGWCKCGHCTRPFYADNSDSNIEDYHVRKPKSGEAVPSALLYCRDLGPSWATPKEAGGR